MERSRAEHIAWCKQRALEYVELGQLESALISMGSDLRKHPDTSNHLGLELGDRLWLEGHLNSTKAMREFIEGFN